MANFSTVDFIVFICYAFLILFVGFWVSREKKGHEKNSSDYFLAGRSLAWWAVGASLIASNISAEQFIGMSGSGFAMGLAIAAYEWTAALMLLIVGFVFLPIFLDRKFYTMPEFLEQRFDKRVRLFMAILWLFMYVFVNLTSVLYLGAINLETIMDIKFEYALIGLAGFALLYSFYGGLKAVALTDMIQVIFLVIGGIAASYYALSLVGDGDPFLGLANIQKEVPGHFKLIFEKGHMITDGQGGFTKDAYSELPGIGVLIGGMLIANLSYWGCSQYITQRALAAKSIKEAQNGIVFAGFLKLLMPLIVVIPGIAIYVLVHRENGAGEFTSLMTDSETGFMKSDKAYPVLLKILPSGLTGMAFAALTAAIVSSLASMANSVSTIFTMDIYRGVFNKNASEKQLLTVGRIVVVIAFFIAMLIAPFLGRIDQAFQFIQEYSGFISPGVAAIFIVGIFWKKATANAALWAAFITIPLSAFFKYITPNVPFLDRMGYVGLLLIALIVIISLCDKKNLDETKAITLKSEYFSTDFKFKIGATLILGCVAALYIIFW